MTKTQALIGLSKTVFQLLRAATAQECQFCGENRSIWLNNACCPHDKELGELSHGKNRSRLTKDLFPSLTDE